MREHLFGLDLIRCAAILLVLGCHCGLAYTAWFLAPRPAFLGPLGYYGVELFFVLSGVLIGQILLDLMVARRASARDWMTFMVRRWLRTLPLYLVWLIVLAVFVPPTPQQLGGRSAGELLLRYATFRQNFFWPQSDWFAVSWSLAIEEWFYLLFSAALLVCVRVLGAGRGVTVTLAAFLALPLILRLAQPDDVNWNEYLHKAVLFRLDAIAVGILTILLMRLFSLSMRTRLGLLALGGLLIMLQVVAGADVEHLLGDRMSRAFGFDVTDAGFALMLPALMRLPTPHRWLARPVSQFAAQSYGTYLIHYTILGWVGSGRGVWHWSGASCAIGASLAILLVPMLFWTGFERPLLRLRPKLVRPTAMDGGSRLFAQHRETASSRH